LNKISAAVIVTFSRQMALLLESGIDIVTSLEMLQSQTTNRKFKSVLGDLIVDIRKGDRLSEAIDKHTGVFPKVYVQSISVGEQAGGLETVLRQLADYTEKEDNASKSVRNAMRYPALVIVVALAVIALLILVVFPAFVSLYAQMNVKLPAITTVTISIARWFIKNGIYVLLGLLAVTLGFFAWSRTTNGRAQVDKLILKLPLLGRVAHLNELIRVCRSMSMLDRAGLPVPDMLLMAIETSNNMVVKQALADTHQKVLKGEGLSGPMSASPIFLPMMVQMVAVGETTGHLESTLAATARTYETEAEDRMKAITGLIQPAITVVLAIIVGFVALSLVSAMYSLYGQFSP
jgi:type IV pilus assembly protein PilC